MPNFEFRSAMTNVEHKLDWELTNDNPYIFFIGELWGVFIILVFWKKINLVVIGPKLCNIITLITCSL